MQGLPQKGARALEGLSSYTAAHLRGAAAACCSWPASSRLCRACLREGCACDLPGAMSSVPRRLSRPSSSELCGRITMFLTQLLPLLDRSGVNVQGAFNDSHSTPVEDVPEVSPHRLTEASYH